MGTVRGSRPSRPSRLRPSSQRCLVASNFTWQPPFAISLPYSSLERNFCCQRHTRQKEPEDDVSAQETGNRKPPHANPHCRASPPSSSLERDFCRRRQAPQKEPEADVSKQRPEIGDYHAQNSAALNENVRDRVRALADTEAFLQSRRERKKVEMRFAHMKRILRLDRSRLRGLSGVRDEVLLTATAQNLRRLAKLLCHDEPIPAQACLA